MARSWRFFNVSVFSCDFYSAYIDKTEEMRTSVYTGESGPWLHKIVPQKDSEGRRLDVCRKILLSRVFFVKFHPSL